LVESREGEVTASAGINMPDVRFDPDGTLRFGTAYAPTYAQITLGNRREQPSSARDGPVLQGLECVC